MPQSKSKSPSQAKLAKDWIKENPKSAAALRIKSYASKPDVELSKSLKAKAKKMSIKLGDKSLVQLLKEMQKKRKRQLLIGAGASVVGASALAAGLGAGAYVKRDAIKQKLGERKSYKKGQQIAKGGSLISRAQVKEFERVGAQRRKFVNEPAGNGEMLIIKDI